MPDRGVHGQISFPELAGADAYVYSSGSHTDHLHNHLRSMNPDGTLAMVDLFAGCGGLSLGLEKAGFRSVLAVEKSDMAAETYYHNFIKRLPPSGSREAKDVWAGYCIAPVEAQFEAGVVVNELAALLARPDLLARLRAQDIDLVAGGPPCQGFSMAGRRNPLDPRNQLPWQFLDTVEAVQPKAVIIENVVGIGQDFLKHGAASPFSDLRVALEAIGPGYVVQPMRVNAMHFGVPEHRPRMLLVGLRSDLAQRHGLEKGLNLWKSGDLGSPLLAPAVRDAAPRTVDDALWDLTNDGYAEECGTGRYLGADGEYARTMRCDAAWLPPALPEALPPAKPLNHNLRKHNGDIVLRFEIYQYLSAQGIRSSILSVPMDASLTTEMAELQVRSELARAELPAHAPTRRLASTLDEITSLIMRTGTKKHSQRALRGDRPSPTIMSLPDDFVHHIYPRTLTVRECARLQSFPDSFEFRSKETTGSHRRRFEVPQYTQVGNAVPPLMAKAIGLRIGKLLQA